MKRIFQTVLLLLVVAGVAVGIYQKMPKAEESIPVQVEQEQMAASTASKTAPLTVTYFTSDVRCVSCRKIEALTRATLEEQFADELESGLVVFETHNIDQAENKHFVDEYQLAFKTVVISSQKDSEGIGNWKKMDGVWDYLNSPEEFKTYLGEAIRASLANAS